MKKTHHVKLTPVEREELEKLVKAGTTSARRITRARILLKADQQCNDGHIVEALDVSRATVERTRRTFSTERLGAIERRAQPARPDKRVIDGATEAKLTALACSEPPEGRAAWTLTLLADRMVQLKYVEAVSYETVRQTLKKTNSSRG